MLSFVASLFGCAHPHCTFPMTSSKASPAQGLRNTYIVCLDCGKEFSYDWQQMKKVRRVPSAA
jgi:predicted transcriptional regulator